MTDSLSHESDTAPTVLSVLRALGLEMGAEEINGRWGVDAAAPIRDWRALRKSAQRHQKSIERDAQDEMA